MISRHVLFVRRTCLAAGLALSLVVTAHATTRSISGGRYGEVAVTAPDDPMRGLLVLFSSDKSREKADQQIADALARNGVMTVSVDTGTYARNLSAVRESCHQLVGDAEAVSHQLERERATSRYFAPIVAGTGQGGTLAMQILAQAPANTVDGAVAIDPDAALDHRFDPCPPDATISRGSGFPGFLDMAVTSEASERAARKAEEAAMKEDLSAQTSSRRTSLSQAKPPTIAHFPSSGSNLAAQFVVLVNPHLAPANQDMQNVSDLPLIELPVAHPDGRLAIVMSGDGGWRDLDKTIAEALQKNGVPVIGWDSLRYFWSRKTPQQVSRDLSRVIAIYGQRWHATHVALIGYSFGADVMPFAFNRLPASTREQVSLVSLLGFAPRADFEIRVTGWLGMPANGKALAVRPEVDRMPPGLVECFYGEHEDDSLCPALAGTGIEIIRTRGGHHFGGGYDALEQHILHVWNGHLDAKPTGTSADGVRS